MNKEQQAKRTVDVPQVNELADSLNALVAERTSHSIYGTAMFPTVAFVPLQSRVKIEMNIGSKGLCVHFFCNA